MSQHKQLLSTKRFLPLFVTQFFGAFNDNAFKNAFLIWFTYDMAHRVGISASAMVTLAAGLFILPFFLFSATAGQLADKYEKARLTQIIKQVEILLMLLSMLFFFWKNIYGLLFVLFLMGTQSTFFGPLKYSLLPEQLKKEELLAGNALIEGATFLSILLGTLFGGLVIGTANGVLWLNIFLIAFALIGWLSSRYIPKTVVRKMDLKLGWNIFKETWKIISHARSQNSIWLAIIGISWFWLIGATFLTLFPVYTKEWVHGNEQVVTLFLALFSIGIGIGSMGCNQILRGKIRLSPVPLGSMGITLSIVGFALSSVAYQGDYLNYLSRVPSNLQHLLSPKAFFDIGLSAWAITGSLLLLATSAGIYIVPLYTFVQQRSNESHVARVIAANNVINALFMVLSSLLISVLLWLRFSVVHIFWVIGLLNIPAYLLIRSLIVSRNSD